MSAASAAHALAPARPTRRRPRPRSRSWPRVVSALEVRPYRRYLGSQLVATTGLWMQRIAQDWLVLELTGSITAVGIAVALQFLPVLVLGLAGGVVADRYPKRTILLITQSMAALMALTLGVLALTGTVEVWQVYAIASTLGLVTVVDNPTRQAFVSELVGSGHIRNAISLNSSVFQFGALLGPAISGVLIHAVGQGWSFLINAASCLLVVAVLSTIRPIASPDGATEATPSVRRSGTGQLREGLRAIARTPEVAWSIALVAALGLFGLNMPVILAAFADQEFRSGVGGYSLFNSLIAVGALSGAVISARRTRTLRLRSLVGTLALLASTLAAASLAPNPWTFAVLLILLGLCTLLFLTGANSLVQTASAPAVRGRVMSVYILVLLGGQALGGPAVGWLIDHLGARPSMALCGAAVGVVSLVAALAMARQSHLKLSLDLRRMHGRSPIQIVGRGVAAQRSRPRVASWYPAPSGDLLRVAADRVRAAVPASTMAEWQPGRTGRSTRPSSAPQSSLPRRCHPCRSRRLPSRWPHMRRRADPSSTTRRYR